ncbi:glucosaminidase domain-containing protein [Enterococcus sp. AZ072]|uniref:glucosaminidase domain-containing protein n=1 Tax=unclassified Enterococcus TaxID=2608891 RepID=UPI003D274486
MKGKVFGLLLGCLAFTGSQIQEKQAVSAEVQHSSTVQQATSSSDTSSSVVPTINSQEVSDTATSFMLGGSVKETDSFTETSEMAVPEVSSSSEEVQSAVKEIQMSSSLPVEKVEENYQFSVIKNQTTEEFIQTIGEDAQTIAWNEELYASVMIAQAILETGSGNSQLGRPPYHNLFGIKGSYQGHQVSFSTQEDRGDGQLYTIQSAFRQYPSYKESLEDYAALLKKGISGNAGFYQGTWKSNAATHQEAAKALTGKYATDTAYDKKLIALIEAYNLTSYDQEPTESVEAVQEQSAEYPIKLEASSEEKQPAEASSKSSEQELLVNQTKQPVIVVPPAAQRPAKQLSGNRIIQ